MRFFIAWLSIFSSLLSAGCNSSSPRTQSTVNAPDSSKQIVVSDGCDGCNLIYEGMPSPAQLSWQTVIASPAEPGERLEISGTILKPDGTTPAPGIILYVYQTDAKGIYAPSDTQTLGRRNGHLRGWMKTNDLGQYRFSTIRPASYPNSDIEQHIHAVIKEPGKIEYWIDEFVFDDDPKLTSHKKSLYQGRGGSGIITLTKNADGVWVGHRDIILGKNIPNYR